MFFYEDWVDPGWADRSELTIAAEKQQAREGERARQGGWGVESQEEDGGLEVRTARSDARYALP